MHRRYSQMGSVRSAALANEDMYARAKDWRFAFAWSDGSRVNAVSIARMALEGGPLGGEDKDLIGPRLGKMLMRQAGGLDFGVPRRRPRVTAVPWQKRYGHIAIAFEDLDGTLTQLAEQGIEPEKPAVLGTRRWLEVVLRARPGRLPRGADREAERFRDELASSRRRLFTERVGRPILNPAVGGKSAWVTSRYRCGTGLCKHFTE